MKNYLVIIFVLVLITSFLFGCSSGSSKTIESLEKIGEENMTAETTYLPPPHYRNK